MVHPTWLNHVGKDLYVFVGLGENTHCQRWNPKRGSPTGDSHVVLDSICIRRAIHGLALLDAFFLGRSFGKGTLWPCFGPFQEGSFQLLL